MSGPRAREQIGVEPAPPRRWVDPELVSTPRGGGAQFTSCPAEPGLMTQVAVRRDPAV